LCAACAAGAVPHVEARGRCRCLR